MIRVAVTTSADRFTAAAGPFRRVGLTPVSLPCIAVVNAPAEVLAEARRLATQSDLIILTSSRLLEILWPDGPLPPVPVAAVGARTAALVTARGGTVEVTGGGRAADLLGLLAGRLKGRRVFFPHAAGTPASTVDRLAALTTLSALSALPVYEARPSPPAGDPVEVVTFASPSAVSGWLSGRSLDGLITAVIGTTTKARLTAGLARSTLPPAGRPQPFTPPIIVADTPSFSSLAVAIARHFEEAS